MNSRTWKRAESEAARIIGGRRVFQKFSAGDAESAAFVADAKKRKSYTQREMRADLDKLAANPETAGRTAVLVLFDTPGRGHRAGAPLVVMSAEAFMDWHKGGPTMSESIPCSHIDEAFRVRGVTCLDCVHESLGVARDIAVEKVRLLEGE